MPLWHCHTPEEREPPGRVAQANRTRWSGGIATRATAAKGSATKLPMGLRWPVERTQLVAVQLRTVPPQHRRQHHPPARPVRPRRHIPAHRQTHRLAKPLGHPARHASAEPVGGLSICLCANLHADGSGPVGRGASLAAAGRCRLRRAGPRSPAPHRPGPGPLRPRAAVRVLAKRFTHSWPTTTHHLHVLEAAGVVSVRRDGRRCVYRLERDRLRRVIGGWLAQLDPPTSGQTWPPSGPRSVTKGTTS
jgi:DNA-binding transcriptional ArsR family regulator